MGMFILPLLFAIVLLPGASVAATSIEDFARLAKAQGEDVAIRDQTGVERIGRLMVTTDKTVTLRFGSTTRTIDRADIFSVERLRDGRKDGLIKGAIFGTVLSALVATEYRGRATEYFGVIATYAAIGYVLDASQTHREPIYRAPAPKSAALKTPISFGVRF